VGMGLLLERPRGDGRSRGNRDPRAGLSGGTPSWARPDRHRALSRRARATSAHGSSSPAASS
jgi:hypothetical protein